MNDLDALLALDTSRGTAEAATIIERVISARLCDAGIWTRRPSDGVEFWRFVERSAARVLIAGRIWTIDQTLHTFCFDASPDRWKLFFDIDPTRTKPRYVRQAAELLTDPNEFAWLVKLDGTTARG